MVTEISKAPLINLVLTFDLSHLCSFLNLMQRLQVQLIRILVCSRHRGQVCVERRVVGRDGAGGGAEDDPGDHQLLSRLADQEQPQPGKV